MFKAQVEQNYTHMIFAKAVILSVSDVALSQRFEIVLFIYEFISFLRYTRNFQTHT